EERHRARAVCVGEHARILARAGVGARSNFCYPEPLLSRPSDAFAALRNPLVRWFALGRLAQVMAVQIISTAVGWQLYVRTDNAWSLGFVGLVELVPMLLFMVPAGNAADIYPRRHIAMLANGLLAVAAVGLAAVVWLDAPLVTAYALLFVVGTSRAFAWPATNTLLPQILSPAEYVNANLWLSSSFEL